MNAQARRVTNTEAWTAWENQVINGVFPLRRFLGGSSHSAVFLTEHKAKNLTDVAIKFVPADTPRAEAQLVQWGAAATVTHPHLVRLFDMGRCQLGGRPFLFVVMEYAEQTLAQILPKRALTPDEVREMLPSILETLAFLHRNHLVHGKIKPTNVLVVNDQLKLASDTLRPVTNVGTGLPRTSLYDPPELRDGVICTAGDLWALGMTLVEALTQRTKAWSGARGETASLLDSLPSPFAATVRWCLTRTPADRPTIAVLEAQYKAVPQARPTPAPEPADATRPREVTTFHSFNRAFVLSLAIPAALLIFLAGWIALRSAQGLPDTSIAVAEASEAMVDPADASAFPAAIRSDMESEPARMIPASYGLAQPEQPAATSQAVLREVTPDVPAAVSGKLRGRTKVTVRVLVDPSGTVVGDLMENSGSSRYFARAAREAAAQWKFAPVEEKGSRVWLLRFEFSRDGIASNATFVQ